MKCISLVFYVFLFSNEPNSIFPSTNLIAVTVHCTQTVPTQKNVEFDFMELNKYGTT